METTSWGHPVVVSGKRWFLHTSFRHSPLILILASLAVPGHPLSAGQANAATQADVRLYRQAPGRTFGVESDTLELDDFGNPTSELLADKFSLLQPAHLGRVRFWGFYGSSFAQVLEPPPISETMRIRIYGDASGLPGGILFESFLVNPSRVATGISIPTGLGPPEYLYDVSLPNTFEIPANTNLWIEIAQLGDINSRFRWENSNTAGEFAVQFPIGTPWHLNSDGQLAYELWTPEPCSGGLLALGLCYMLRCRKR